MACRQVADSPPIVEDWLRWLGHVARMDAPALKVPDAALARGSREREKASSVLEKSGGYGLGFTWCVQLAPEHEKEMSGALLNSAKIA